MNQVPAISVVIPARNEEAYLGQCLESLAEQSTSTNPVEIIVVDNGSHDRTAQLARAAGARVISEPKPGVGWARQAGFRAAQAPLIATTDADSQVPRQWLATLIEAFNDPAVMAVGGPVRYAIDRLVVREFFARTTPLLHEFDRRLHRGYGHLIGANMAVRQTAFASVGGFRTHLNIGEDLDLSHRLRSEGEILFLPHLRVTTSDRRFREVGPRQLWRYLAVYLAITKPEEAVRDQLRAQVAQYQRQFEERFLGKKRP